MSNEKPTQTIDQFIVIDDDASTLFLCKIIIERLFKDMTVTTYNNPQNAIDYFVNAYSDSPTKTVIILDINMPQCSGWEVLDVLNTLNKEVKESFTVIMLSSSIDPKDKMQAINHPLVLGYLEKPLTVARLDELLQTKADKQ